MIALLLWGCGTQPVATRPTEVVYTVAWAAPEQVREAPDGLHFHTDRGFDVRLTEGRVVTYSVMLGPCRRPDVGMLWGGSTAWAGHSAMANPTASRRPMVEDLRVRETRTLPPIPLEDRAYCAVEVLLARGDRHTEPDTMNGLSLHLVGEWTKDGRTVPFAIDTPIAHGTRAPIASAGEGTVLDVRLERSVDGLFDGIDFAHEVDARVGRQVLKNLVSSARFTHHLR